MSSQAISRRRKGEVLADSTSSLLKKSLKGVWLFIQVDTPSKGEVRRKYFVHDILTADAGRLITENRKEALDDYQSRVDAMPAPKSS